MPTSRLMTLTGAAGAVLLATVSTACGVTPLGNDPVQKSSRPDAPVSTSGDQTAPTPTQTPAPAPVELSANVDDGASKVKVDTLVKVSAQAGTVSRVKLTYRDTDRQGQPHKGTVDGSLSKDKQTWTADERLEPSADYTLTMSGTNVEATKIKTTTKFTTMPLALSQQTFASLYPLKGSEVGIGMPVVVNFDVAVKDRKSIEKNLHVTSSPDQPGSWHWFDDKQVRYRPKDYWKPGTKVSVDANINGVNAGNGIYGQKSAQTSFEVGRSLKIKINLASDVGKVYRNGEVVRTMDVSGGKQGWQTRSGVKLIMGKEYNKKMTNEMIGAEEDYSLVAQYALRITNSGEFIHSAPWNASNFGRRNASHGCTGTSTANASWLYSNTLIGDPVITTGSSRKMEMWNGYGDWNVSYKTYQKGSAL